MTTETKHTLGRCTVGHHPDCRAHARFGLTGRELSKPGACTCQYALFAAAPELLAALQEMTNHVVKLADAGSWDYRTPIRKARAAITRAMGEKE